MTDQSKLLWTGFILGVSAALCVWASIWLVGEPRVPVYLKVLSVGGWVMVAIGLLGMLSRSRRRP